MNIKSISGHFSNHKLTIWLYLRSADRLKVINKCGLCLWERVFRFFEGVSLSEP